MHSKPTLPWAGITLFLERQARQYRQAAQASRLRRELSRLPLYVARDIGAGGQQDRFITRVDD